jgi:cyclic pyranopterin phosphate synthase
MRMAARRTRPARRLTHLDARGQARMVDVGAKPDTAREAVARGEVRMRAATVCLIAARRIPKGDVLALARVAGIMAAKRTPDLVPLCHPLPLTGIEVEAIPDPAGGRVRLEARVRLVGKTGAEMEALVAVAVAALTIYDMCKAVDREMVVGEVRLVRKSGGKSGTFVRPGKRP